MPTVVQFRRGTSAQNDNFTGAIGELSIDTEKDTLRVHDGSTTGGFELVQVNATQTLTNKTLTTPSVTNLTATDGVIKSTASATTVSTGDATIVAQYAHGDAATSIEYVVHARDLTSAETQVSKALVTYDTTTFVLTEFGTVFTGDSDLGSCSITEDGTNLNLNFTRRPSNNISVKVFSTIIA